MTNKEAIAELLVMKKFNYTLADAKVFDSAIEALIKQIPKKPPDHDRTICPSCNSKARYGNPYEYFCPHCGQAIDWSDDE